jgi:hypothetical protein
MFNCKCKCGCGNEYLDQWLECSDCGSGEHQNQNNLKQFLLKTECDQHHTKNY